MLELPPVDRSKFLQSLPIIHVTDNIFYCDLTAYNVFRNYFSIGHLNTRISVKHGGIIKRSKL